MARSPPLGTAAGRPMVPMVARGHLCRYSGPERLGMPRAAEVAAGRSRDGEERLPSRRGIAVLLTVTQQFRDAAVPRYRARRMPDSDEAQWSPMAGGAVA